MYTEQYFEDFKFDTIQHFIENGWKLYVKPAFIDNKNYLDSLEEECMLALFILEQMPYVNITDSPSGLLMTLNVSDIPLEDLSSFYKKELKYYKEEYNRLYSKVHNIYQEF